MLVEEKYPGRIHNLSNVEDVVQFALKCSEKYNNIFIGGNGQQKIIEITESLNEAILSKIELNNCNDSNDN